MKRSIIERVILFVLVLVIDVTLINFNLGDKFKSVTIELGTESIKIEDFLVHKQYLKRSKCLTDMNTIDLSVVGEYDLEFSFNNKKETVKLKIEDTTAPEVDYIDLKKGLDYKFDPNDFVSLVKDKSAYTITSEVENPEFTVGEHYVDIAVTDEFGNKTVSTRVLYIGVFQDEVHHELGEKLTKEELLISAGFGAPSITNEVLSSVDVNKEGEYILNLNYDNKEFKTKVIVEDTKGPNIVVNNINFYLGDTPKTNENFIKSIKDPSGIKEIKYEGDLDYTKIGSYELKIIATDNLGNETVAIANLNVKNDNVGPVFSGLGTIYATKNQAIDFSAGVQAKDAKDGIREFSVDTSGVNLSSAGTFYAIYTASDTSNNVTTKKRKIVVSYDMSDLESMARSYYDKYLAGKSVIEMTNYIKKKTGYKHTAGSDVDAYFAILSTKSGSCRGHAMLLKSALDYAGYQNMIIKTIDGTHWWNLVYENGKWRHYDSTPGRHIAGPATDVEKMGSWALGGRKWDTSAYPQAN